MRIAIIGADELGKLIAYHAIEDSGYEVVGYYDDFKTNTSFDGYPILGKTGSVIKDFEAGKFDKIIIAIGYNHMDARASIFETFKNKIPFANIIHSSAYIDKQCKLGEGIFILPKVAVDMGTEIDDNVLLNTGTIVAHHTKIGKHSFVAPGVHFAGLINVGEKCFIGIGAIIKDCITIENSSVIGAGSLVLKDTEKHSVSIGSPAKIIKYKQ
ncbi:NeuD/PglB/VioB family sugar acetyltransferase [Pedobacter sp.]|uniref:NeuD/PglB/VioB family sugar acetyltransferase n=1 Tax=Pedobacter sp. TaxID=1411316 RepID=UPI003BAABDE6